MTINLSAVLVLPIPELAENSGSLFPTHYPPSSNVQLCHIGLYASEGENKSKWRRSTRGTWGDHLRRLVKTAMRAKEAEVREGPVLRSQAGVSELHCGILLVEPGDQSCWSLNLRYTQLNFRLRISSSL